MVALKRDNGFTLMEAVVSMIIIMTCYAMSTMIYLNILRADNTPNKTKAFVEVNNLASKSIHQASYGEEEIKHDNFLITKKLDPYKNDEKIKVLSIIASDGKGRVLYSFKQLVIVK